MLIFDQSRLGRRAVVPATVLDEALSDIPESLRRLQSAPLPEVSELQAVRHYTRLSQKNFSIDTHFYPLGSCTILMAECLLIEPTETDCKEELDGFVAAMAQIQREAEDDPDWVKGAPRHRPVRRLDEVRVARDMGLAWRPVEF